MAGGASTAGGPEREDESLSAWNKKDELRQQPCASQCYCRYALVRHRCRRVSRTTTKHVGGEREFLSQMSRHASSWR